MRLLPFALLSFALHASSVRAEPPSLPSGWWIATVAEGRDTGAVGDAWRFGTEIVTVDAAKHVRRVHLSSCESTSASTWACAAGNHYLLIERSTDKVVLEQGRMGEPRYGRMKAQPATTAEAATLDALLSSGTVPPPPGR